VGIPVTTETVVHAPLNAAFETIVPIDLAKIFRGLGPLPAVVATREQTAPWDRVGASRLVELSDGSSAHEQLTAYRAPEHFAYRLDHFTGTLRLLVSHADGAWWFSEAPAGTHVRWTYTFQPRAGRALAVQLFVAPLWKRYQRWALALAAREAEASA
jgi:hypothetical protein